MKKIFGLLFCCLILFPANTEILSMPFTLEEFDVNIMQYPYMIQIDPIANDDVDYKYAFTNTKKDYEVRYSFFKDTGSKPDTVRQAFSLYSLMIACNASGTDLSLNDLAPYKDADVFAEFYGSFGNTSFVQNPKSSYCEDYKYIMMSAFYKDKQGIVFQSILFNDIELTKQDEFWEVFHSFKFHD